MKFKRDSSDDFLMTFEETVALLLKHHLMAGQENQEAEDFFKMKKILDCLYMPNL